MDILMGLSSSAVVHIHLDYPGHELHELKFDMRLWS